METGKILLRYWEESDTEALFKYASDPDVGPRAGWPVHKSVEESREIIRTFFHNETTWAIVLKETGEAVLATTPMKPAIFLSEKTTARWATG